MIQAIRAMRRSTFALMFLGSLAAVSANAQWYNLHGGSLSVGGTGQFSTDLTPNDGNPAQMYRVPFQGGPTTYSTTVSNQKQFTTTSAGFISSLQFHPVAWAGIAINYGFTHYQERYTFNYAATTPTNQSLNIPTDTHELTAAYQFHVRKLPWQPFVNIGGGAIDFAPANGSNQWREAGLLEAGWDMPVKHTRFGFRVSGRSLYYRAPNFRSEVISTHKWRVTEEPSVSTYYRF